MKCGLYIRVSTAGQAEEDKTSLPEQAREFKALARARGWEIVSSSCGLERIAKEPGDKEALTGVFGDPGISGDGVETRLGLVARLEAGLG